MPRKTRRDTSEVSCVVKYLMFGFNVLFWVSGNQKILAAAADCLEPGMFFSSFYEIFILAIFVFKSKVICNGQT